MTLNGVMAVTLRYFTEVGKPALQKTISGGIYARVYCIFSVCTMSSQRKFTFAISSPAEFLVICPMLYAIAMGQHIVHYVWRPKIDEHNNLTKPTNSHGVRELSVTGAWEKIGWD